MCPQRLIETSIWGDDPAAIDQQLVSHARFHSSVMRSVEVQRARDELVRGCPPANARVATRAHTHAAHSSAGPVLEEVHITVTYIHTHTHMYTHTPIKCISLFVCRWLRVTRPSCTLWNRNGTVYR